MYMAAYAVALSGFFLKPEPCIVRSGASAICKHDFWSCNVDLDSQIACIANGASSRQSCTAGAPLVLALHAWQSFSIR